MELQTIKLSKASKPFGERILFEEVLFVSDTESFTKEIAEQLSKEITARKCKCIVLLGDILSFLELENKYFTIFNYSLEAVTLLLNTNSAKHGLLESKEVVGKRLSEYLYKKHKNELDIFLSFVKLCKRRNINIIYYSGNHDAILSNWQQLLMVPIFKQIDMLGNFYVPEDLELIKLSKDFFLLGTHTINSTNPKDYGQLREFINSLRVIENPERIIFVSHLPGNSKYSNLGSSDITLFKRRFKFKYHYHGHCKDYYGEYLEENVPTRSVHIKN